VGSLVVTAQGTYKQPTPHVLDGKDCGEKQRE
jgi:hypothetical protein